MPRHLVQAQPGRATLAQQSRFDRQRRIALALHRRVSRPTEPPDYIAIARRALDRLAANVTRSDRAYALAKASHDAMDAFIKQTCAPLRPAVKEREQRRWQNALAAMSDLEPSRTTIARHLGWPV
jgi:hypothetical protein